MKLVLFLVVILFSSLAYAQLDLTGGTKHNASEPIDITSDSLTVSPKQDKALFSGNVVATQADLIIKSDKLTVYYRQGGASGGKNAVKKIEVDGNVDLKVPGRHAKSNQGVYDVDASIVTLTGNVRLEKEGNVLTGEKFIYNVAAGTSQLLNQTGAKGEDGVVQKKGRVRAVLTPSEGKKK